MKQRFQKASRLGDTEIIISAYGPIGGGVNHSKVSLFLEEEAKRVAREMKELTDSLREKEPQTEAVKKGIKEGVKELLG